ncbi:cell division protein FtsA [Candidatus Dependentiae bacterium]
MVKNILSIIDIGTTKICVLVATQDCSGKLDLIGFGQHPSLGLKKGVVVNITKTVDSIKNAIKKAEEMAKIKIENVTVGISGGHIKSFNSTGVVAVKNKNISQTDIDRVIESAKAIVLPEDQEILHILPQYFKVDGQNLILDSLGMHGIRLEAQIHIITGAITSAQNIIQSCELAGVKVNDIVLEQIASADAVLSPSEKELGVGILDIGGGTSDFAIYRDGRIMHSKVIAIAGNHFTNDLAIGLSIPIYQSEEIKKQYGFVWKEKFLDLDTDTIKINLGYTKETTKIEVYSLYDILAPRAEEVFDLLNKELIKYKLKHFMPSGIVITGGGSLLSGIQELAKNKFKIPIRIGTPNCYKKNETTAEQEMPDLLKSPIYSTGYGLLIYASNKNKLDLTISSSNSNFKTVFKRMKSWIYDFL